MEPALGAHKGSRVRGSSAPRAHEAVHVDRAAGVQRMHHTLKAEGGVSALPWWPRGLLGRPGQRKASRISYGRCD